MMGNGLVVWMDCCQSAVKLMQAVGMEYTIRAKTVQEWHKDLRENGNQFIHPNPLIAKGVTPVPLFLAENPESKS